MIVSSIEGYSGKSAIIIALGLILRERGYRVGYFKPIGFGSFIDGKVVDEDALNTARALKVEEPIDVVCPIVLDKPYMEFVLSSNATVIRRKIVESYEVIKSDKDVVLIEGSIHYQAYRSLSLCDISMCSILNERDLMVVRYTDDTVIDRLIFAKSAFGHKLRYAIFNQVYGYKKSYISSLCAKILEKIGLEVIGIIPRDSKLLGIYVDEIADILNARYLVRADGVMVERFLIGAMSPQSALDYFRRCESCAVITGGDRTDLINLALEIPNIRCLILTGNMEPPSVLIGKAEERGIPVLIVEYDTLTTFERIQRIVGRIRVRGDEKIERMKDLITKNVDIEKLIEYAF